MEIDLCIVAGRRPHLLKKTLDSFRSNLLETFNIRSMILNVDPIFGSAEDGWETVRIARSYFPDAVIHQPESPSFCEAVRRVWASSRSDYVLHLEDDWLLNERLGAEDILPLFRDPLTMQVSFNNINKHWRRRRGPFHHYRRKIKLLGVRVSVSAPRPCFTTSPSILRGHFAREASRLMDPRFDPEKQFYGGVNAALEDYVRPCRNRILGYEGRHIVTDIGREWRDEHGIRKHFVGSQSVWEGDISPDPPAATKSA